MRIKPGTKLKIQLWKCLDFYKEMGGFLILSWKYILSIYSLMWSLIKMKTSLLICQLP